MDWKDHITVDPEICHGRACITGTRVLVSTVLDNRTDGLDSEEIMRSYPSVTRKSLQAAVRGVVILALDPRPQAAIQALQGLPAGVVNAAEPGGAGCSEEAFDFALGVNSRLHPIPSVRSGLSRSRTRSIL